MKKLLRLTWQILLRILFHNLRSNQISLSRHVKVSQKSISFYSEIKFPCSKFETALLSNMLYKSYNKEILTISNNKFMYLLSRAYIINWLVTLRMFINIKKALKNPTFSKRQISVWSEGCCLICCAESVCSAKVPLSRACKAAPTFEVLLFLAGWHFGRRVAPIIRPAAESVNACFGLGKWREPKWLYPPRIFRIYLIASSRHAVSRRTLNAAPGWVPGVLGNLRRSPTFCGQERQLSETTHPPGRMHNLGMN